MGSGVFGLGNLPEFQLDGGLATKDGDQHSDLPFFGQDFVDGAFVTREGAFLNGDGIAFCKFELDGWCLFRNSRVEKHFLDFGG